MLLVLVSLQLTFISRFATNTTKTRVPIGSFFGHTFLLPWELSYVISERQNTANTPGVARSASADRLLAVADSQLMTQVRVCASLLEDIQCRYSLACNRLESLLASIDDPREDASHTHYFLLKKNADEDTSLAQAYNECVALRLQLNVAQQAIRRLRAAVETPVTSSASDASDMTCLRTASADRLRVLCELLLDSLVDVIVQPHPASAPAQSVPTFVNAVVCEDIFRFLCVNGSKRMQVSAGLVLVRSCADQPWWGRFLGNMLQMYFSSDQAQVFPQDRSVLLANLFRKCWLPCEPLHVYCSICAGFLCCSCRWGSGLLRAVAPARSSSASCRASQTSWLRSSVRLSRQV